ncbi:MAG: heavy metal-binding domain-containing protein [Bacteroidales bacterium]|nr:heavy metal-binding domain-containing protein [Bacteroidales bacterium]
MKKTIFILFLAFQGSFAIISCNNSTPVNSSVEAKSAEKTEYTCPMHPEVLSDKPGDCPKCGMPLEKKVTVDTTKMLHHSDSLNMK